jgi:hypothetical protein
MVMILCKWMIAFLLLLSISGCERRTQVTLEGGNPPTFILSGSGVLSGVVIYSPERLKGSTDEKDPLWEIKEVDLHGELVERVHSITYGVVPAGYQQATPATGAPPPLIPGKRYRYWIVTGEAPGAIGYFEIRDGVAVAVDVQNE